MEIKCILLCLVVGLNKASACHGSLLFRSFFNLEAFWLCFWNLGYASNPERARIAFYWGKNVAALRD